MNFNELKVKSVEFLTEKEDVYDINVEDVHHYILDNGIVTHNTMDLFPQDVMKGGNGLFYAASTIVFLSKAQLKSGEEDELDLNSSGIIVTAKAKKNRLAKPKKVKFEISFEDGSNPYVGLDWFCNAENFEKVGIAKGKMEVDKSTGELVFKPGGNKWYCRHLNKSLFTSQLFSGQVFTRTILEALDPIIIEYFSYSSLKEADEYEKMIDEDIKHGNIDLNIDIDFDEDLDM